MLENNLSAKKYLSKCSHQALAPSLGKAWHSLALLGISWQASLYKLMYSPFCFNKLFSKINHILTSRTFYNNKPLVQNQDASLANSFIRIGT